MSRETARESDAAPTPEEDAPAESDQPKKAPPRKASAKKAAPRKAAGKRAPSAEAPRRQGSSNGGPPKASRIAAMAASQLLELTGKESEGVVGLERDDDGWRVEIEVLELRRIPATTDVLATYEVTVDRDGDLVGYRRLHRYVRGTPGDQR